MSGQPARDEHTPPLTAKGDDRRRALLDAAEHILIEQGNARLSMRAVAATAGVRLGHLQYYFPARADLIQAVLARALERSLDRLTRTTGAPAEAPAGAPAGTALDGDPADLVAALLTEHADPRLTRLFAEIWALAARDDAVASVARAFYRDYRDHVATVIARANPGQPDAVNLARAEVLVMLLEGASLFRSGITGDRSAATDTELVRTALRLLGDAAHER
ncbi:TetR/AcrR family transcriptional regulator [Nonomuraea roseoviolacea]|uniref:AcrR family transcriptional regulator n=1 Tax=Nonomuraea roseoviolacea subsp. carminata TaxID=160689 RepID=A0ABT1K9R7_9ACTN|nr:TetR family transcriptional regulator [Nonomuraea roseoviolacea]MCP2350136.1 AcrR family transcriptional regulator [Nonomuraea roseoviolacea subsp. carminata]